MNIVFPSERIAMMNMHATLHLVHAIRQASALHCIHHCEIPFVRQQKQERKIKQTKRTKLDGILRRPKKYVELRFAIEVE